MDQSSIVHTLINTLSSCNGSAGYFFSSRNYDIVNELIQNISAEYLIIDNKFDIGFLKVNNISKSVSIIIQKFTGTDSLSLLFSYLSDIELLMIDEDCLEYTRSTPEINKINQIFITNHQYAIQ